MNRRRVVVTGLGTVNPLGLNVSEYWQGLQAGRSGIATIAQIDTSRFKVKFAGEVKGFTTEPLLDSKAARRLDRFSQFAVVASEQAVQDSGLDFSKENPFRCGVILGSGIGGLNELEEQHKILLDKGPDRVSPFVIPKMIANAASGNISIRYELRGPNTTVTTACSSAAHAIGDAMRQIAYGFADVMVTGGTEAAITSLGLAGFIACRALSNRNDDPAHASRPFDKDRDGFVLSEGAGILILEEYERAKSRGAPIYCEVMACGNTADAFHITAPHDDGVGAAEAMRLAMHEAGWNSTDLDYINAHGTSTPLGDKAETVAIKTVFGDHAHRLAISSTKSALGHSLGASGGIELVIAVQSVAHSIIPPTINLEQPDPACDLDYTPRQPAQRPVRAALSNSFGFGGHNACLVVGQLRR